MYSPILRNRQSEVHAIRHLSKSVRPYLKPVLDVAAPTKSADKAAGLRYVERNIDRTEQYATNFPAVFVDSSELDPEFRLSGGVHPMVGAAAAIVQAGCQPIPTTGLHRDVAHRAAAISIMKKEGQGNLCIRLDSTDVSTATLTFKGIQNLLADYSIESSQVVLLLDMQCLYGQDRETVVKQIIRLLKYIATQMWYGIIVGGYGIPDQLSTAVSTKDQGYLPRIEQDVFYAVATYEMETPTWLADYTVLPPSVVELDWRLIRKMMSPRALYAMEDFWFVVRGGAFSSHPDEYKQYFSIADKIVALEEYCGETYSYGDKYISDRSKRVGTPGSPASWITACVNHHITFTANAHSK